MSFAKDMSFFRMVSDAEDLESGDVCKLQRQLLLVRPELSASGGDVDAAALADGTRNVCLAEDFLEREGSLAGGSASVISVRGIERYEIHMGVDAL